MRLIPAAALAASFLSASAASAVPFEPSSASNAAIDPIANYYQKHESSTKCKPAAFCTLKFPKITETRVLITHVTCDAEMASGTSIISAKLLTNIPASFSYLPVFSGTPFDGSVVFGINTDTYEFFNKGDVPVMLVGFTGSTTLLECTLAGYHDGVMVHEIRQNSGRIRIAKTRPCYQNAPEGLSALVSCPGFVPMADVLIEA
jgi:hypothetical protein